MGEPGLPGGTAGRVERPAVDEDGAFVRLEQAHHQVEQGRLAAAGRPGDPDMLAGADPEIDPGQAETPLGIAEADAVEDQLALEGERLGLGLRLRHRRLHQLDDVAEGLQIAAGEAPAVIGLLEQGQEPLGAERERSEHRDRLDHSARLEAHRQGDERDRHQPRGLDHEARRPGDELVGGDGPAVAAVELAELGLEQGFGAVEDDVADSAEPLLDGPGPLDLVPASASLLRVSRGLTSRLTPT